MPPTVPPPPKGKPKGKLGFLGKKIGPFSAWVWLVMLGGSVAIWFMLRRSGGEAGGPVDLVTGSDGTAQPQDAAGAGAPAQNAAPGTMLDPALIDQLSAVPGDVGSMARAFGTAAGAWEDAAGQTTAQLGQFQQQYDDLISALSADDGSYYGNGSASSTVAATLGPPGQKPTQKSPVMWGGRAWGRGQGKAFIRNQLAPRGVNPQSWARKHPAAASYLGIPTSSPAAHKASPARPAPRPVRKRQAAVRPKAAVQRAKVARPKKQPVARKAAPKRAAPKRRLPRGIQR